MMTNPEDVATVAREGGRVAPIPWETGQPNRETTFVSEEVAGPILAGDVRRLAERIVAKYPVRRSALVPLLYLVQSEVGWVPRQGMREVAEILGVTTAEVEAVATFYTMVKVHPCGRYVLSVCTNPSCTLLGARRVFERAAEALGPIEEHVTQDGLFTLEEEECLGACDRAPVVAVNYYFYDRVGEEGMEAIIDAIRRGDVPEASRGGVPGDWRSVSRILAGVESLRPEGHGEDGEDGEDGEEAPRG